MKQPSTVKKAVLTSMKMFNEEYGAKFALTDSRVSVWGHLLRDCQPDTIMCAAYHLLTTMKVFPPEIATMRETVIMMSDGKLSEQTAIEAWERVLMKIKGKDLELSEMEKAAINQIGSMYDLKHSSNSHSDRARFIEAFNGIMTRHKEEKLTMPEVKAHVDALAPKQLESSESPKELPVFEPSPTDNGGDHLAPDVREAIKDSKQRMAAIVAGTGK